MKALIIMAWRNLWRSRSRTLITVASVFLGVLLSTFMSSMQEGSYSTMIDNIVKFYSGYIQVHNEEYWENKSINNLLEPTDSLMHTIREVPEVQTVTQRLESFALASSETITRASIVFGIEPEKEEKITEMKKWITDGTFLKNGDDGVLIGSELAKYLNLSVKDTLVLIGQGYHGVSAAGKYPIRGILEFPTPDLNRQSIYMDLANCQEFYSAPNLVSSLVIMIEDHHLLSKAMRHLEKNISSPYSVMSWDEMQPQLLQMIEADRAGGTFMKAILYTLIGFGIFGTILMMLLERSRELGVTIAIGMQRFKLTLILFFETLFIGFIGVLAGFAGSIPLILYFFNNPIRLTGNTADTMIEMGFEPYMYFSLMPSIFYHQVITIFIITVIIALYPLFAVYRLKVHLALRA